MLTSRWVASTVRAVQRKILNVQHECVERKNAYHYIWHLDKLLRFHELLQERKKSGKKERERERVMKIKGEKKMWGWREKDGKKWKQKSGPKECWSGRLHPCRSSENWALVWSVSVHVVNIFTDVHLCVHVCVCHTRLIFCSLLGDRLLVLVGDPAQTVIPSSSSSWERNTECKSEMS